MTVWARSYLALGLWLTLLEAFPGASRADARFANHEVWEREISAAEAALSAGDLEGAKQHTLAMSRELSYLEPEDPRSRRASELFTKLWPSLFEASPDRVAPFVQSLLGVFDAEVGRASRPSLGLLLEVGLLRRGRGEWELAKESLLEARKRSAKQPAVVRQWLSATVALARTEVALEQWQDGESHAREARDLALQQFGPNSEFVLDASWVQARAIRKQNRLDEAAVLMHEISPGIERMATENPRYAAEFGVDYGTLLNSQYHFEKAKIELKDALDSLQGVTHPGDPVLVGPLYGLAWSELMLGDWNSAHDYASRAVTAAEEAEAKSTPIKTPDPMALIRSEETLAEVDLHLRLEGEAQSALRAARARRGDTIDAYLTSAEAEVAAALGNAEEADRLMARAEDEMSSHPTKPTERSRVDVRAAELALSHRDFSRAESLASRALPALQASPSDCDDEVRALDALGRALVGSERLDKAAETFQSGHERGSQCFGETSPRMEEIERDRAALLDKLGRTAEAKSAEEGLERIRAARQVIKPEPGLERIELREQNLALRRLKEPWGRAASPSSSHWMVTFLRLDPSLRFDVGAVELGVVAPSSDELLAVMETQVRGKADPPMVLTRRPLTLAAVRGTEIVSKRTIGGRTRHDVTWVGVLNGFSYYLNLSSEEEDADKLVADADEVFANFSPLDATRVSHKNEQPEVFESQRFHYSVRLGGSGLRMARPDPTLPFELLTSFPTSDPRSGGLTVLSVSLRGVVAERAEVESALSRVMIPGRMSLGASRPVSSGTVSGSELAGTVVLPDASDPAPVRVRVFVRANSAVAVAVAVRKAPADQIDAVLQLVERLSVDADDTAIEPADFDSDEKYRHALFYNNLGIDCAKRAQFARAAGFYAQARTAVPSEVVYARNLEDARVRANQLHEAVSGATEDLAAFPGDARLYELRGRANAGLGSLDDAARDLKGALDLGGPDDELVSSYVDVLLKQRRFAAALQELEARIAQAGTPKLRALHAFTLQRAGRDDDAKKELRELVRTSPDDESLRQALIEAELETGDHEGFLAATEPLAKEQPTAMLLYMRARAQDALGLRHKALESLDEAAKLDPASQEIAQFREHVNHEPTPGGSKEL